MDARLVADRSKTLRRRVANVAQARAMSTRVTVFPRDGSARLAAIAVFALLGAGCGGTATEASAPLPASRPGSPPPVPEPSASARAASPKPTASAAADAPSTVGADQAPASATEGGKELARTLLRAVGIGGSRKTEECNALIQVINTGIRDLEMSASPTADPSGVGELRSMAVAMDKVAAAAAGVKLTIPQLTNASAEYQAMVKAVAKAARDMANAARAKDAKRINAAQAAMEKAVKAEDPLVDRINAFCQGP